MCAKWVINYIKTPFTKFISNFRLSVLSQELEWSGPNSGLILQNYVGNLRPKKPRSLLNNESDHVVLFPFVFELAFIPLL